jgi:hypothetical protein
MNPSATSPATASAFGPYAAIQTSSLPSRTHGIRTGTPCRIASRPSARSRITPIASRTVASDAGRWPITRLAESPRPMPHTVRLPNMSLSVANSDAVTDQSRVSGLVTIGPMVIFEVAARTCE